MAFATAAKKAGATLVDVDMFIGRSGDPFSGRLLSCAPVPVAGPSHQVILNDRGRQSRRIAGRGV
jgi:hypothetical protein